MTQVLFLHGAGDGAFDADAPLAAGLADALGAGFHVDMPRLPSGAADEQGALDVIAAAIDDTGRDRPIALVGHSAGGYLLLKCLATRAVTASVSVICIVAAPFPGADADWTFDGFDLPDDLARRLPDGVPVFLYASVDDDVVPMSHRDAYAAALPHAQTRTVTGGHQLGGDPSAIARDIAATVAA